MTEGLLDTSVVIDLASLADGGGELPDRMLVSAITMAELVQGPLFARTSAQRRARARLVRETQRAFPDALPFDDACVAAYESVATLTVDAGRHPRRRTLDLLIAATAHAHGVALVTRNPDDVDHLTDLIEVIEV